VLPLEESGDGARGAGRKKWDNRKESVITGSNER